MGAHLSSQTSTSLLGRLRQAPTDQAAWRQFVERYGPGIYGWCRGWNLQEADAQDVTQDVLLKLAEKMRSFAYDSTGSFRAWLRTVTRHAWCDFIKHRQHDGKGDSEAVEKLDAAEAREDLIQRLDDEFDREMTEEAMACVQLRVEPRTWEAFRLLALEGWSGARAAQKLDMKVATVFVARSNVQKLLREEIRRLDAPE